jgi:predicted SnoaL-like aldol condensation-catalyzing enzyme
MRRTLLAAVVLSITSGAFAGLAAQSAATGPLSADEQLIIDFFGFSGSREVRAERFMTPDYVQHNPRFLRMNDITGATGNQAWVAAGAEAQRRGIQLVALPGIPLRNPIIVLEDGDLVHAIYRGTRPDPATASGTYDVFAFESFRIRDGRFSEHWDQVRLAKGWMTPAPRPQGAATPAAGPAAARPAAAPVVPQPSGSCDVTADTRAANKRLALSLVDGPPNAAAVRASLANDFVDHAPRGLVTARMPEADAVAPRRVEHVLAECDYVSIVWKQTMRDPDDASKTWELFTFDAFRLRDNRVVEHWNDEQR